MKVNLFDMVLCFSKALDLLHPKISDHHLRVGYIAACIAEEMKLPDSDIQDVFIAGALHDVGAASSVTRLALLDFAMSNYTLDAVSAPEDLHHHGHDAYLLMRDFPPFVAAANMVRFHHVEWNEGRGAVFDGCPVPLGGHILNLADRVAILPDGERNILLQSPAIRTRIATETGRRFKPDVVDAFLSVSERESFWLDAVSPQKVSIIRNRFTRQEIDLDLDELHQLARIFGHIIDYRSPFTAQHSTGVATVAEVLAIKAGFPHDECRKIGIAGLLHDVGKLSVPVTILNKPGPLDNEEISIIRQHSYHTYQILSGVPHLETIRQWAAWHHERIDGTGYPFRNGELPYPSRLIAVADIFTAITEDRPYRAGMSRNEAQELLNKQVTGGAIDGDIVALLHDNFDEINANRKFSQSHGGSLQTVV